MTFPVLLILLTFVNRHVSSTDYCAADMRCEGMENSGCNCNFGPNCQAPKVHNISDKIRNSLLVAHNKYREKVASGQETRGGVKGGATEMYALQYDKGLEYTANCWNKKCAFRHDQCRSTKVFRPAGQNLYWSKGTKCEWKHNIEDATQLWYGEIRFMTATCFNSFGKGCSTSKVGHFTQLVWAKSTHVGCSLVEHGKTSCQIACNYGPAGNYLYEPVFSPGSPASRCKYKSESFKHLCLLSENQEINTAERSSGQEEKQYDDSESTVQKSGTQRSADVQKSNKKFIFWSTYIPFLKLYCTTL